MVYAVANEGARPEIPEPEGPLGRLIAGNITLMNVWLSESFHFSGL